MARSEHLLLDTHALIWWWREDEKLPAHLRDLFIDPGTSIYVSAVSPIEIAIKQRIGKLVGLEAAVADYATWLAADDFQSLDIRHDHAIKAGLLLGPHKDPFDRLLAAQALIEDLTLVSRDHEMAAFGCEVLW